MAKGILEKLWLYGAGVVILIFAATLGPKILKPQHTPTSVTQTPGNIQNPVSSLPSGLHPIMADNPPIVIYRIIAESLIKKLAPASLITTPGEYETLCASTGERLRLELGLALPGGYVIPNGVTQDWIEKPSFLAISDYVQLDKVKAANIEYTKKLSNRLMDQYANQTVKLLAAQFASVIENRKSGDDETLQFLFDLYGKDFVQRYMTINFPPVDNGGIITRREISAKVVQHIEADVAGLWHTEFSHEELTAVKNLIIEQQLGAKLFSDFTGANLGVGEKGLLEKTLLGYRLSVMHSLTITEVASKCTTGMEIHTGSN